MRRADRLFRLVQELRRRRFATAAQLAEALEVSVRTVYRDIRDLEASGIPIRGEAGVGYRLERGFELPPLTFNAAEIEALVLGLRVVESRGDPDLSNAARSVMAKVGAVLPDALRTLLVETPLFAPGVRREQPELTAFRRAIAEKRRVVLGYRDASSRESERVVRPLGLYFWGDKWTVAAWCEMRADYRNFRTDRVDSIRLLDRFDDAEGPSLAGFIEQMQAHAAHHAGWVGDPRD